MSGLSTCPDFSQFLENKIRELDSDLEYTRKCKQILRLTLGKSEASDRKNIETVLAEFEKVFIRQAREFITVTRQKRLIKADMEETGKKKAEEAYALAMVNRVRIPRELKGPERKSKKHQQKNFRVDLEEYYDVVDDKLEKSRFLKSCFCMVTGKWYESALCKAAHIVPKILESQELNRLFGGPTDLSDPRNGALRIFFSFESNVDIIYHRPHSSRQN